MKHAAAATLALLGLALPATAQALITQPSGLVCPQDSKNGEKQLYTMFSALGEPIEWQQDGLDQPDVFEPKCKFTATLTLRETASSLGLAWYNATGTPPEASDLHLIVPAGSPVGTVINSTDIKSDPAYLGGAIGFALVGTGSFQTHYTQSSLNPVCSGCPSPAPWVMSIKYLSKTTPNAYYITFEDGAVGSTPNSFNNDGDYNDYVYFVTGVTCQGGGAPCDTGQPGVCSVGTTQCTNSGLTCHQVAQPAAEACDGVDNDCDGDIDEGDLCAEGFICQAGTCAPGCQKESCPEGTVCDVATDHCVDPLCEGVACPAGSRCVKGTCAEPCDGVVCPHGQACVFGTCVDPCLGITCDANYVCVDGACVDTCDCSGCPAGSTCQADGTCASDACQGVTCPAGQYCAADGTCADACAGAVCPAGSQCQLGACVAVPPQQGQGGSAGSAGAAGGSAGQGGAAGDGGAAGAGAGQAGAAGAAGAGAAGDGGAAGSAGTTAGSGGGGAGAGAGAGTAGSAGAAAGAAGSASGAGGTSGTSGHSGASGSAGGSAGAGGAGQGGLSAGGAAADGGSDDDGGCGCTVPASGTNRGALVGLALGLAALWRRRRAA